ncbi:kinase-like domain-containing protein [Pisolithus croceorrhizus]|nr:kinase-like domain-containing protein [Pisolithus croceorrhizus]KAI6162378.1 kinase-like domain-containing protein [Pisolithus thermaeus]
MFRAADLILPSHTILVKTASSSTQCSPLPHECAVLDQLHGIPGIPQVVWTSIESKLDVIIFEDPGKMLEDIFKSAGRRLSLDTVVLLAEQLITCLQHIHSHSYIYSNFSPQNILIGPASPRQQANQIILFNFSLVELYRDPQTYAHVPFCHGLPSNQCLPPTAFSSMNYHQCNQLSRWDDLQSLAYLLVYLTCRLLPWIDAKALSTHDILQRKQGAAIAEVCSTLPLPFTTFLHYVHELPFTHKPDYSHILSLFQDLHVSATGSLSPPFLPTDVNPSDLSYWMDGALLAPVTPQKCLCDAPIPSPTPVKR